MCSVLFPLVIHDVPKQHNICAFFCEDRIAQHILKINLIFQVKLKEVGALSESF